MNCIPLEGKTQIFVNNKDVKHRMEFAPQFSNDCGAYF